MSMPPARDASDAVALATALGAIGIACVVEARAGLAVIRVAAGAAHLASTSLRRDVLALGRQHGFTHVAVELEADAAGGGAPLLRD
jgi:hypothetical protein